DSVLDVLMAAYNFWAPLVLVQIVAAIWGVRARMEVFAASALSGLAAMLLWNGLAKASTGMDGLAVGVLANLIVFLLMLRVFGRTAEQGGK
ncbi:MAG: hypothetical protein JXR40_12985, partial [Pontiellaceae bacterium]|nr:hypothetical protein [Pontiellaceae bacterium]